ncbi:DNA topoisomerase III [Encephalitozoon intestinalis ATCC 50506]|uniref:DNA topoisomerase n=1 Tax=Encephalitozoon intestinalis (strain ATCC 50506) TaxID=876142 RepID=E0S6Q9_ENCIT|nr:DNA topoisomerase III [Encephalitozoon intestinalis ATCC 50506]ADM11394.2 DNA topoisomerase III [Encephalitozoon intestinalis ATCC 50506]UTX45085.1 DNA topoisomerase III [Encephalitozoon intestinalis]
MRILNVAEKPSVARSISSVLSKDLSVRRGLHQYCPNIQFDHGNQMVFTSVLGHVLSSDFENKSRWDEVDPETLFTERIVKYVQPEFIKVKENIEREALKCDMVVIWTDCDREGENIGRQIRDIVLGVKKVEVKRARFSGITLRDIEGALGNLGEINEAEAEAVEVRMELDLRIGSAFTRLQTLSLGRTIQEKRVLSFGPCQVPTLGFVVERARERESFVPEMFWTLMFKTKSKKLGDEFTWRRGSVFDKNCVICFHRSLSGESARIVLKEVRERTKYKPLPLRTVELQKKCSSYFKLSGHKVMEIAEGLYNKGYISYPRTETDAFDRKFDFKYILGKLCKDSKVGEHAEKLIGGFDYPRNGRNNDMAHSPIYPLKEGTGLSGKDRDIYDFICRRFLGCISKDAKGLETRYELKIGSEMFDLKGIRVVEKNYLEVYYYDKWDDKEVSDFQMGEMVSGDLCISEGKTTPPNYLTEAELISLMDKNGIGTDATIHEHIQKIQERGYAIKVGEEIRPLELGAALIGGYERFGLNVGKPELRKSLEGNLKKISEGRMSGREVVKEGIIAYRDIYALLKRNIEEFVCILRQGIENDTKRLGVEKRKKAERAEQGKTKAEGFKGLNPKKALNKEGEKKRVECDCKDEAKVLKVKKGDNTGKEFYCCGKTAKRCYFFQWCDKEETKRDEELKCFCGFEPQLLVANTENNKGRKFFKCKKAYKPCKFFQWEE